ncbi:alkaline phosphatase family protein [Inhella inkyongensis]|nr:alkaline phosphatase family protein [Inhella inkyongensis]
MLLRALTLATLSLLGAEAQTKPQGKLQDAPPRLVVLLVVDGLPMRQVQSLRPQFGTDGLRRFYDQGTVFTQAHYAHAHTVTAAGHATLATGAYPQRHGVVGNEWLNRASGASVYNTEDRAHRYLDNAATPPDAGTSPKNLLLPTFGDQLRQQQPQAKVIGISGKDRGAILPAGHRGTAYLYRSETGRITSSSYYMAQLPAWVHAFNAKFNADRFWQQRWSPLLPAVAYAQSTPDDQAWMGSAGFGKALPATLGAGHEAPGPRFYTDVLTSPFGDELLLDFARAAIRHEGLGQDEVPDVLSISLSSHDYINHTFGPDSRLSNDHLLQLDRLLARFFQDLDREVGSGRYVLALASDHGFLDSPEARVQKGLPGGRVPLPAALSALNRHLEDEFAVKRLVHGLSAGTLLFDVQALQKLDAAAVQRSAARFLTQLEGMGGSYTEAELESSQPPRADQPHLQALRLSYFRERSGQLGLYPAEGWLYGSRLTGSTHGSPWAYDQELPLLFWGPSWIGQAVSTQRVQAVDLAPTLLRLLQAPPLPQAQGQVLPLPAPQRKQRPKTPPRAQAR